jgi:phosphatidylglycerol---prolipoprotein diacylglyceryl transferase
VATPIGLGLGRIANFINGELWGRPAPDWVPFRMTFPNAPDLGTFPRYPSQIYEAFFEGLVLFCVMIWLARSERLRVRFGFLTGAFLAGYAVARITGEFFREPDAFLGFLWAGATMGQLLSIPLLIAGIVLMARAREAAQPAVTAAS